jgi:5-hydroxyisourate hydrolase
LPTPDENSKGTNDLKMYVCLSSRTLAPFLLFSFLVILLLGLAPSPIPIISCLGSIYCFFLQHKIYLIRHVFQYNCLYRNLCANILIFPMSTFSDVITTHVLDQSKGTPAAGISITLQRNVGTETNFAWENVSSTVTNQDGRGPGLAPYGADGCSPVSAGVYKIIFFTKSYFDATSTPSFYPQIEVIFNLADPTTHYHVPLLLSPFGYSTYRGS